MRIAIDYTSALRQRAGIGRYTRELVRALLSQDRENRYLLIKSRDSGEESGLDSFPNLSLRTIPLTEWAASELWHRRGIPLPLDLWTGRFDLFHSPDFLLPPLRQGKRIVTVHDLSFIRYPQCFIPSMVRYLTRAVPKSIKQAHMVVAVSQNTKHDLVELLGVAPEKIEVIYPGAGQQFSPVTDAAVISGVRQRYNLHRPFILFVGTLEPRKNLARLIEAFGQLKGELPHELLVVGRRGWLYQSLFLQVEEMGLEEKVRFLDFVPDEDLPPLLTLADVFAYPSLYEGFGFPPLEAMACGTPVVSSNTSSLPEVLGEAALLVNPTDTTELAQALNRALTDDALRRTMVAEGRAQAATFNWAEAARKQLQVYRRVAQGQ